MLHIRGEMRCKFTCSFCIINKDALKFVIWIDSKSVLCGGHISQEMLAWTMADVATLLQILPVFRLFLTDAERLIVRTCIEPCYRQR